MLRRELRMSHGVSFCKGGLQARPICSVGFEKSGSLRVRPVALVRLCRLACFAGPIFMPAMRRRRAFVGAAFRPTLFAPWGGPKLPAPTGQTGGVASHLVSRIDRNGA